MSTTVNESPVIAQPNTAETVGFGNARVATSNEYFKRVRHHAVRGAKWASEDVYEVLNELGKDPIMHAERRFVSLINEDHGELAGAAPGIFIGVQLIHPGELVPNHRHNSVAIITTCKVRVRLR